MTANSAAKYEQKDIDLKKIGGYTLLIVIFLAAIILFLNEYFIFAMEGLKRERDSVIPAELRELRAAEEKKLNSYKVLDAANNKYQIPIDRAMKLIADEAFEKRKD